VSGITERATGRRRRGFVGVRGPDAADYLQRMLSNDVEALAPGESCEALLLTAKARVIAPLVVIRRADDDFLLLTEPELAERVRAQLLRTRFAARAEIEVEEHESWILLGGDRPVGALAAPTGDYGRPGWEVLDAAPRNGSALSDDDLELLRIEAGTPRFGREIDDRVLPAEAGLVERAVSFSKGCYPGQEPIARLHYRGHANRGLRRLALEGDDPPGADAELELDGKVVGRVTSAARRREGGIAALAYVRREVPDDVELTTEGRIVTQLHSPPTRP
jgi:tRNA-modifying protein YgfZ